MLDLDCYYRMVCTIRYTFSKVEFPKGTDTVCLELDSEGEVNYQMVNKFNEFLPDVVEHDELELDVEYDSTDVSVNDVVTVRARVSITACPVVGLIVMYNFKYS